MLLGGVAHAQKLSCTSTVVGRLEIFPLKSSIFRNTRMLRVWLPPGYGDPQNARRQYKVLYLLDGQSAFDACTAEDHEELGADEVLTRLIALESIEPIIAVGVDNGSPIDANGQVPDQERQREREYLPWPDPNIPSVQDVAGSRFPAFMQDEVMPAIASRYRVQTGPRSTAIWGASYSGVAAVYALIKRPDLFGLGIIESPAVTVGNGQMLRDTASLVEGPSRVAIGVGTKELGGDFPGAAEIDAAIVHQVQLLADHFRATAIAPPQVQLTVREGAKHSTSDFGARLAAALTFLFPAQAITP